MELAVLMEKWRNNEVRKKNLYYKEFFMSKHDNSK